MRLAFVLGSGLGAFADELEDAVAALVSVGYSEKDGRKRVEQAAKTVAPGDLEGLVRAALQG